MRADVTDAIITQSDEAFPAIAGRIPETGRGTNHLPGMAAYSGARVLCRRVICAQDAQDAAHRGSLYVRAGTPAGGADRCDFRYNAEPATPSG